MPDKKKAVKPVDRRTVDAPPRTTRSAEAPAAAGRPMDAPAQLAAFDAAMKQFHARNFKGARELFVRAEGGTERDVAQRARAHIAMCDSLLSTPAVDLRSADDYYNYGVALMNSRNPASAREYLEGAARLSPGADHVHYALGLAHALAGDLNSAYESLKLAIELEPLNRALARQDADLAPLANQPPLDALLYPEKAVW